MRIYSATDVGQKRKMNQDYVFVSEGPVEICLIYSQSRTGWVAITPVTMHPHMRVRILVDEIREDADYNPVKVIRHAIETANTEIRNRAQEGREPPGHGNHYGSGDYCRSVCLCGQCR